MPSEAKLLGAWGEDVAADYLRRKGYKIIGRNYACRMGEIDIIAEKGRYIIFAEVKLRKNDHFANAADFVTEAKQRRIFTTAEFWLSNNRSRKQPRFDVIEIYAPDGFKTIQPTINHLEDAFGL